MSGVHRAVVQALEYAKTLSPDVRAVYVNIDPAATEQLCAQWKKWGDGVPLVVLESPYRSLMEPLLEYIDQVDAAQPDDFVTIVLPEFVPARWWHHVFHNQRALLIKGALLFRPNVVVTSVPFHLQQLKRSAGLISPIASRSERLVSARVAIQRKVSMLSLGLRDPINAAHIRAKRFGDDDRSIRLLIVLQNRNQRATDGQP